MIDDAWVRFHLEVSSLRYAHESGQQGLTWHAILIEHQVAIVNGVVAKFGADITNLNTCERLMRLETSNWYNEWLDTIISLERNAASKDDRMCGLDSKIAWPEFCSLKRGSMDHKLIRVKIECCRGLKTSNV